MLSVFRTEEPGGFLVAVDVSHIEGVNRYETEYLYDEIFVARVYQRGGVTLPEGAIVFDVGANIGMYSLFVHAECPSASIFAFEPLPPLVDRLRRNIAAHGARAELCPYGLADAEGEVSFTYYPGYSAMSTQSVHANVDAERAFVKRRLLENARRSGDAGRLLARLDDLLALRFRPKNHSCRVRRLSSVIDEYAVPRIDVLKIDVQRAELDVLRGIDERHWELIRQIALEVHDAPGTATAGRLGEVVRGLADRGYRVSVEQDATLAGSDRYGAYAIRP